MPFGIQELDEAKGTLRLLLTVYKSERHLIRTDLMSLLKSENVGKSAFYGSLEACIKLGLLIEESVRKGNISYTHTQLTPKGLGVAEKLGEIREILEE